MGRISWFQPDRAGGGHYGFTWQELKAISVLEKESDWATILPEDSPMGKDSDTVMVPKVPAEDNSI